MHGNIILTRNGIYLHHRNKKVGDSIKPNETIRRMTSQINNPSTGIVGLNSQSSVLAKSAFSPGTSIMYGGSLTSHLSKLNFNTNKKADRNVRLRL
jgi:hypothetical protein